MADDPTPTIEIEIGPARDCRSLAAEWRALEALADGSFYLSWHWIGSLLAELPPEIEPLCLRARRGGETVGLAILTWRQVRRRGLIPSRQLHLNTTGDMFFDQLTIEYNDFLLDRRFAVEVRRALLAQLAAWTDLWEELFMDGVDPSLAEYLAEIAGRVVLRYGSACPYVDLAALEDAECLAGLGRNTRHQIRRTSRLLGNPTLEQAVDAAEGAAFFDGLVEQHRAIWGARGKAGAFWNDFLERFHRRLIAEGVPAGWVQLLRTRSGDGKIVGHLYNFVYRGRVYSYQSGFARFDDNRIKPGLLSHHLAIVANRAAGRSCYDFMAGDRRYKRSLSNREGRLVWIVGQRPALRFTIEHGLRQVKRFVEARVSAFRSRT